MIRVLHMVACISSGGMEAVIMNYYKNIDRSKIQFDFLVRLPESSADFYKDEILNLGGNIYRLPYRTFWNKLLYPIRLYVFLRKHKEYTIVHSHMDIASTFYLFIAKLAHIPIRVAHSHNTSYDDNWKKYVKKILKPFLGYVATHKMACGEEAGKWLFGSLKDVIVLKNAIDVNRFRYDEQMRESSRIAFGLTDKYVIGHVGHFEEQKNHKFLIEIFANIKRLNDNAILLLIGSGGLESHIKDLVAQKGLVNSVIFAGTTKEVEKYLACMDVFVFPSLYEGMSVALMEAQCSGLRCFASKNMPQEINLTGLITFISLDELPSFWANCVVHDKFVRRKDMSLYLESQGYSIKNNALVLQNFYLNNVFNN